MAGRWDEDDWSMQLAAEGATEISMHDLNEHLPEAVRKEKLEALDAKKNTLTDAAQKRDTTLSFDELKEKNKKDMEKRLEMQQAMLPKGWKMIESKSRPGEYVYENTFTEERQAWFPTEEAVNPATNAKTQSAADAIKEKNRKALEKRKQEGKGFLPEGWKKVESSSSPGEFVYENIHTEERVAWFPLKAASKQAMPEMAPATEADQERGKVRVKYAKHTAQEIDLEEGDMVIIEYKAENGWWVGTNTRTGQLGLFPGDFVKIIRK